ncbi:hypothetical protein [Butyrivibrio sp. AE3004]|uniref:hypothetical protein n=1 Tax=Butyrivibrio sp. AE3004 TaxID=1506994 RepID=UPI000493D278|nr:hypothetical protein [Butyrivibrio sp. AE3004]
MSGNVFENVFDGMFESVAGEAFGALGEGMKEYEKDQKRPSVTTLPFKPVPKETVEALKAVKTGLFKGSFKKKLLASIEDGRTKYAEVLLLSSANKVIRSDEDDPRLNTYCIFYKVADLNGRVLCGDIPMIDDAHSIEITYNNVDFASDKGCPDVVDPNGYQHVFLLEYFLGDDEYDVLLTSEQFADLKELVKCEPFGGYYHFMGDGTGHRW